MLWFLEHGLQLPAHNARGQLTALRSYHRIARHDPDRKRSEGWMNLTEAAAFLERSPRTYGSRSKPERLLQSTRSTTALGYSIKLTLTKARFLPVLQKMILLPNRAERRPSADQFFSFSIRGFPG